VRTWHSGDPGQGARTDLTYLPDPHGQLVFINATTVTTVTLLRDLTNANGTTIARLTLPPHWTKQFPHHIPNPRQIKKALNALNQIGTIHHNRHHITISNHTLLTHIAKTSKPGG